MFNRGGGRGGPANRATHEVRSFAGLSGCYNAHMAQLVIPPGFGHLALSLTNALGSKTCIITDGFKVASSPYTQTNAGQLGTDLRTALMPLFDTSWTIGPLSILVGNDGPKFRFDATSTNAGTRTAQAQPPPQVSLLIKKTTGFAGRKFRGRAYWPYGGPVTTLDEQGKIIGGEATIVNTAVTAWTAALNSVGGNTAGQFLLHSDATPPTAVISFSRENVCATQRRRLNRAGT